MIFWHRSIRPPPRVWFQSLAAAPSGLPAKPRIGERLEEFDPREVRRILVGHYELRYEIQDQVIYILRIWHTREDR